MSEKRKFQDRHIGITEQDEQVMLQKIGYSSVSELIQAAMPDSIFSPLSEDTSTQPLSEPEVLDELKSFAKKNRVTQSLIGQGYYGTLLPEVIKRNVLENPGWYTAYTPYQPEVSQGRLEALLNFQTMVSDLTGLDIANSSMLDEATAVVEAMLLARRATRGDKNVFLYDQGLFPQTVDVLVHRAKSVGIEAQQVNPKTLTQKDFESVFGIVLQYPDRFGSVADYEVLTALAHNSSAKVIVATDLLALTLLKSPGEFGADIAVGNSQRFGVPMGFGGPHAGFMAVKKGLERQLPGRLVGVSVDQHQRPAYRLTLQTREQHIRREKATSNICTAQVLLAVLASMYAVYHGPTGLKHIAESVHKQALQFARDLEELGVQVLNENFFDTVRFTLPKVSENSAQASSLFDVLRQQDITIWKEQSDQDDVEVYQCSFDEQTVERAKTAETLLLLISDYVKTLEESGHGVTSKEAGVAEADFGIPAELVRSSEFLTHPIFNTHHTETQMMRYLKYLVDRDYALDRGMIPLGSCTMKLNAATEMAAITWPEFANIHPFAPAEDVVGYLELIEDLQNRLAELTGYDTVSVQPNAGSQGELAGLLAIRGYLDSKNESQRDVCLIPSSAHGTNAASAVLAGMRVVVVASDEDGNVDIDDLQAKIAEYREKLATLMVTYPSTHGVYEEEIRTVCDLVHEAGGQVYIDGANMNALVGFSGFGDVGGDVSHLNLHKTFAIPHGGGGPGVGPVAAKSHLAPFLPGHRYAQQNFHTGNPVSAAAYGSAGVLPISWAYIRLMGLRGLQKATAVAVLSANYIAKRLSDQYPILYTGSHGLVAHECILDIRKITADTGITAEDIAKRLIDYGFHAPTMSFPVAGTLMVEPTESEDFMELERFISAMSSIFTEIEDMKKDGVAPEDSVLRNAPHSADILLTDEWDKPYSRKQAAYPFDIAWEKLTPEDPGYQNEQQRQQAIAGKYWPPVSRVDNAYGDRNLMCACPDPEAFSLQTR